MRIQNIDIVLSSVRVQMYAPDGFRHLGINPESMQTLIVKSSNHFRAAFGLLAGRIECVNTPGAINFDFANLPYRVFDKPYYPRVANPFEDAPTISQS